VFKQKILKSLYPRVAAASEKFGEAWVGLLAAFAAPSQESHRAAAVATLKASLPDYLAATRAQPRDPDEWIISRLRGALNEPAGELSGELHRVVVAALLATWASSPRAVQMAPDIAAWAESASANE
jgi:hypothetical protein